MAALRASYTIAPEVLLRFNELVPSSERSRTVQSLMEGILNQRAKELEAVALEFSPMLILPRREPTPCCGT